MLQIHITFCLDELLDFGLTLGLLFLGIYAEPRPCNCKKMDVNLEDCKDRTSVEVTQDWV
jgi:hypothetical protein